MRRSKRACGHRPAGARHARRRRHFRKWLLALASATALSGVILYLWLGGWLTAGSTHQARAAIVDQLSLTDPNPAFVDKATDMLEQAGYTVDYYPGEEVTVDFYRDLPTHDYKLIILRAHSAVPGKSATMVGSASPATVQRVLAVIGDDAVLFTSEPYSKSKYPEERAALRLFPVQYDGDDAGAYLVFGIASGFITSSMRGEFQGTTIVLGGCSGLTFDRTAVALEQRGASAVFGWSGLVTAAHTDAATERLLQHLLVDRMGNQEAVAQTEEEVGPDPDYASTLLLHQPR